MKVVLQGDLGSRRRGFVHLYLVVPCLLRCDWAHANWAEMALRLDERVEVEKQSQQNIVSDHHGPPVVVRVLKLDVDR